MRKPYPGEKASGIFEEAMQQAGIKEFKLEPDEIVYVERELRKALEEEAEKLLKEYPEKLPGSSE